VTHSYYVLWFRSHVLPGWRLSRKLTHWRERERERGVLVRDATLEVVGNYISGFECSQAVSACPSGIGNTYDRNYYYYYVTLEGLHYGKIWGNFGRAVLGQNFNVNQWEGCLWSMQYNVQFGYQLSICSRIEEKHGKPCSSWPVAGPSGCELTSSQQSGFK
jgi:hypothetical protein